MPLVGEAHSTDGDQETASSQGWRRNPPLLGILHGEEKVKCRRALFIADMPKFAKSQRVLGNWIGRKLTVWLGKVTTSCWADIHSALGYLLSYQRIPGPQSYIQICKDGKLIIVNGLIYIKSKLIRIYYYTHASAPELKEKKKPHPKGGWIVPMVQNAPEKFQMRWGWGRNRRNREPIYRVKLRSQVNFTEWDLCLLLTSHSMAVVNVMQLGQHRRRL